MSQPNAIVRIRRQLPSLPPTEQAVAHFVLNRADLACSLTIEGLAEQARASYATVNRFCRRLGYAGYRAFRQGVLDYLTSERDLSQLAEEVEIFPRHSVTGLCADVHRLAKKVLDDSFDLIDPAVVEAVAEALVGARRIAFAGVGASGIVAQYAACRLFRLGLPCQYWADSTLSHMQAALLQPGDVLVAVSSSGRTEWVADAARLARAGGATVVGVSDFCATPLAAHCHHQLFTTGRSAQRVAGQDIQFLGGQMALLDTVMLHCRVLLGEEGAARWAATTAAANSEKADHRT